MPKRILFFVFLVAALFLFFNKAVMAGEFGRNGEKRPWTDAERIVVTAAFGPEAAIREELGESPMVEARMYTSLAPPLPQQSGRTIVTRNQYGQEVGMLPPAGNLPTVGLPALPKAQLPALPTDTKRSPVPPAMARPQASPAPVAPQAPKAPPAETAKAVTPQKDYQKGEVVGDQAKRLYLKDQPVGEIRARKGRLKGELVNVDQNNLHIHIWPGPYLSRIAIPVDGGQYKIAHATGKGWVISPEKTTKIPAGCEPVRIGD